MWTAAFRATKSRCQGGLAPLALALGALLAGGALMARADPPPTVQPELSERAQLFIALLRRRAEAIVEARRAPPPSFWNAYGGLSQGHESNVNLDGSRKGDLFTEESFSAVARPRVTSWLGGELTYDLLHTHYSELTDSNLWSNTLGMFLKFTPAHRVELTTGYEYGLLNFPHDTSSSFNDQRTKVSLAWAHTGWLTHVLGWVYQLREYDTRKARDSAGAPLGGVNRQDQRHTGSYELRFRFPKLSARLGTEWYRNSSNDQVQDFYDWDDVRVRAVVTRIFSPKWVGTFSASQEHKNYQARSVPAVNTAERDDLVTVAGSLIYQATPHASVTGSVTYRHQDSNDPRLDFTDWMTQLGVSLSF